MQTIGGFCALLGVFILALPVPIVVNRYTHSHPHLSHPQTFSPFIHIFYLFTSIPNLSHPAHLFPPVVTYHHLFSLF